MIKDLLRPLNTSGKAKEIKIGSTYPHGVARKYTADMRKIVREITKRINAELMPVVREQFKQRNDSVRMDGEPLLPTRKHTDKLEYLDTEDRFDSYEYELIDSSVRMDSGERMDGISEMLVVLRLIRQGFRSGEALSNEYARATYNQNEKIISQAIEKQLGVAIQLPEGDAESVRDWVDQNTELIKDLQEEYLNRIQAAVTNGFLQGRSTRQVAQDIQKATGITWRGANNIARNEIGNLNAQIAEKRNQELGIDEGIWRTAKDERVRGNPSGLYPKAIPSHWANESKRFKLSQGINGQKPGQPNNCRCWTESVIPLD